MNQNQGVRSVEQGAATPVRLALLPPDGPTGGYFNDEGHSRGEPIRTTIWSPAERPT